MGQKMMSLGCEMKELFNSVRMAVRDALKEYVTGLMEIEKNEL